MTQHDTGRIKAVTGTGVTLALAAASVASASGASANEQHHTVRKGETVSHLAARTGVSVAAIARANDLSDPSRIYAGQRLVIPTPGSATTASTSSKTGKSTATATAKAATHTVASGDTVSHLATRYGTSVSRIIKANGLDSRGFIVVGQKLEIPGTAADSPAPKKKSSKKSSNASYTVASGDTVSAIATRHGVSISAIVKANGLDSRAFIRAGQQLTIPGAGDDSSSTTPKKKQAKKPSKKSTSTSYTVVAGDTVSAIAARFSVTASSIVSSNGLDRSAFIRVGQQLTIPGATSDTPDYELPESERVPDNFAGRKYPQHVVASANKNKALLLQAGVPSRATMQSKVAAKARAMGVSAALAQAVAFQESGFNHASVSPANAIGTMQVIPTSGDWAADLVGHSINLLDPDDNVTAGVAILRQLIRMSPDLDSAIAGYYQGASSVRKYGMYSDTRRYVANVRTLMERFA